MILDVRRLQARARPNKRARLKVIGRAKPGLEKEPTRTDQKLAEQIELAVQTDRLFAMELKVDLQMVL